MAQGTSAQRPRREMEINSTSPALHLVWFIAGAGLGFAIPFVFTSILSLHHDLYYLIYFAITTGFLVAYVRAARINLWDFFRRNWHWSLGIGAIAAAFLVFNVVSRGSTASPTGPYLAFEVFWRGVVYGVVDALLLTAFPGMVALALLKGDLSGIPRKLGYVAASLVMVLVITGTYHLGYSQFRDNGIRDPEVGNVIISVPLFATANPLGSVLAHSSMHVAATIYSYETEVFLPPAIKAPD